VTTGTSDRIDSRHKRWELPQDAATALNQQAGAPLAVADPGPAAPAQIRHLDVGCGDRKERGFVGIDRTPFDGVDVVFDIDSPDPWPFKDGTFDLIRAVHILEHMNDPLHFLSEIHRIGRNGCVLHIVTPHFSSCNSWSDPTHVRHYASTFMDQVASDYFAFPKPKFKVTYCAIHFSGLLHTWPGWLVAKISRQKYERYYAWRYPANSIWVRALVLK
jgi:SAM-dependent methyltransferase